MASQRILVIDDDPSVTDFLRRGLSYEGYAVDVANTGKTGLYLARERPPDVVVLDIMMPGLDGLEVCQRLKAGGNVPVLMLTARDAVSDKVKGLETGADDYLVKPFAFDPGCPKPSLMGRVQAKAWEPHGQCPCSVGGGYRDVLLLCCHHL